MRLLWRREPARNLSLSKLKVSASSKPKEAARRQWQPKLAQEPGLSKLRDAGRRLGRLAGDRERSCLPSGQAAPRWLGAKLWGSGSHGRVVSRILGQLVPGLIHEGEGEFAQWQG